MTNPYAPPSGDRQPSGDPARPGRGPSAHAGATPPPGATPPEGPGGAPAGYGPHAPRPAPTPTPAPPTDPEAVALAGRRILHFALLMLGSIVVNVLPLPWKAASLAFVVAAIAFGIRALIAVRRSRLRGSLTPMLVIGLVVAGLFALTSISTLATWPLQMRQQECLADALTISAQDACESQYREDLIDWQKQLQGMTDGQS